MVKPLRSSSVLALTAVLASGVAVAVLATPAAEASAPAWSAAPTWSRLTTALFARSAPVLANLIHPDRWLLWLGVLFVLSVYHFPTGVVGRLRAMTTTTPRR